MACSGQGRGAFPQVAGLKLVYLRDGVLSGGVALRGRVTALTVNGVPVDWPRLIGSALTASWSVVAMPIPCSRTPAPGNGYCRDTGVLELDLLVEEFNTRSPVVRRVEGRIVAQ